MDNAIIYGAGTYGQVYAEYLKDTQQYNVLGFLDDDESKHGQEFYGVSVLGNKEKLYSLDKKNKISIFAPIGNNEIRNKILTFSRDLSYKTPCFIHPTTQIHSTVKIGQSVYVLPSTSIMPYAIIEDNVMISMGANVAHHTKLGEGCFISQGVNVGASIEIGEGAFLGIASTIMTGIKSVGRYAVVGAGAVVIRDVPAKAVIVGNPGKIIKYKN